MGYCNGTRAQSWRTTRFGRKKLHGRVFHGRLAWRNGRWHHATRNGRFGWWWDVGGIWYFYPDKIDGPPDYASTIEVADDETAASSDPAAAKEPHYAFYYRPGELSGTRYQTFDECSRAREQAGVGVCVLK